MAAVKKAPQRVALYTRVSTADQTTANQLSALREVAGRLGWNVVAEFKDSGFSGAKGRDQRPGFDKLWRGVTRGEFDLVAAWSVDRIGRSMVDLLGFLQELRGRKVDLYLHQQGLDTSTPSGRAMFQMLGVFAEWERELITERVQAGLARARAQGVQLGRPKVAPQVERRIRVLRAKGIGKISIARRVGCGVSTVQRVTAPRT
jgi:DNA invertase Pin-like site-specific DNA recombinase